MNRKSARNGAFSTKLGVHSAGARLSSHCPGGCKSRYLHPPAPSIRVGDFQNTRVAKGSKPWLRGPCVYRITSSAARQHLAAYHRQQMQHRRFPVQLSLPLDCSASAHGGLPQNREQSKRPRSRLLQARLEANLAMLGRLDTVPGSLDQTSDVNNFRQGQRFKLTPLLSTLINEVNGKRWPGDSVATLPTIGKGEVAKFSEGRPFVGRGSLPDLQTGSLGRH